MNEENNNEEMVKHFEESNRFINNLLVTTPKLKYILKIIKDTCDANKTLYDIYFFKSDKNFRTPLLQNINHAYIYDYLFILEKAGLIYEGDKKKILIPSQELIVYLKSHNLDDIKPKVIFNSDIGGILQALREKKKKQNVKKKVIPQMNEEMKKQDEQWSKDIENGKSEDKLNEQSKTETGENSDVKE